MWFYYSVIDLFFEVHWYRFFGIFLAAGEILATSDLSQHTVPGYDLYVYVSDGKTLVGPRTLTVIISGKLWSEKNWYYMGFFFI